MRIVCNDRNQVVSIYGFISPLAKEYLDKNGFVVTCGKATGILGNEIILVDQNMRDDDAHYEEVFIVRKDGAYCMPDGRTTFSHSVMKDWMMDKTSEGVVWMTPSYELNLDGSVSRL